MYFSGTLGIKNRKMDNRGSKSNKGKTLFVKEQRVDGSCIVTPRKKNKKFNVKVYSNGFWKKLSKQSPF